MLICHPTLNKSISGHNVSKMPPGTVRVLICHILFPFITPTIAFRAIIIDLAGFIIPACQLRTQQSEHVMITSLLWRSIVSSYLPHKLAKLTFKTCP